MEVKEKNRWDKSLKNIKFSIITLCHPELVSGRL